jgi:quinoprotein glucose dehydrogenase
MAAVIIGWILVVLALGLGAAGGWLAFLGGSLYYLALAVGLAVSGGLLVARRPLALWAYALVVAGSLAWAVWEVGLDWWQLAPRGDVVVLIGLVLLLPWIAGRLQSSPDSAPASALRGGGAALSLALVVSLGVGVVALFQQPNDRAGRLPLRDVPQAASPLPPGEWHAYGRDGFGQRFSPLDQITPQNVGRLELAWQYHTGDLRRPDDPPETTYEVTPLMVDDTLYLCTPHHLVIALDAATGEERWRFDPQIPADISRQHQTCRGVSYHADSAAPDAPCGERLFLPAADARLIALDARSGEVCSGFGDGGAVDLWAGMPYDQAGFFYATSPPVIAGGLIVVGGAVNDNVSTTLPAGVVRAYDVATGELVWNFDSGQPQRTEPIGPEETYSRNSPNSWSVASVDEDLGLVYLPMGNQSPDQWGGGRTPEAERFSSSITALDLATGEVRWVFQTVRHDLWDMDVPAQPSLLDLETRNGIVPALVAPTKQGDIYVLDRRSGEPLLPVSDRPAPQGAAEGDWVAARQPVSALSFEPPPLNEADMWGLTLFDQLACRILFRGYRYEGRYTPPSLEGSLVYPGNFGVFNWGGVALDPQRQIVVGTPGYLAFISRLIPREDEGTNYVSDGNPGLNENYGAPFAAVLKPFLSPLDLPCQAPPWGYIGGADLQTGQIAWLHPNGTVEDQAPVPLPLELGVPDLGGPVVTAGGVAFISGTLDYYARGYDVTTGEQLWRYRLPAGGQATPMTYSTRDGRQMVVVVAGGHGSLGTKEGDAILAFALPER